ncbi:MAG TPA: RNA-binding protein [Candidatus Veblenbacteria bacterium]|uniref:RNA-binding protein n=2 Tax=Candidatus Vebleniibacteriota TaxID=1817921 RepID=A0A1G2Q7E5_9BACT|nr:MAG: RNP-1 like protein RNA-binding protein [Parcubacteria group bacterium GW2011_GWA1_43_27]OHA56460.1 MAG: RNA-binding protein [Candidatus Veblenbacteria bacterium RIFOXYD1_FULL_43_11]OHA57592.1 MAG: RNA-binding protein [Candidatus Veblenbacteria bacterium RIFOXYC2_FULL_42_11]HBT92196.1 RNA-binding protein [Candidatus Veblenbacteria bacterium]HBZ36869.1 RNA-binding protein [Candidatus Veblenbacteria bacterium]
MATKLYIGGLPYSVTDDQLKDHFSQAGTVTSASVVVDRMSGRSRGFGFVEMSTDEEAQSAISMFHGKDFNGRNLTVNEARPMAPRAPRTGGGGGGRGGFRRSSGGGNGGGNWQ